MGGGDLTRRTTGGSDATVRLWDVATGACLRTLTGHTQAVRCVAVADMRVAVSAGDDNAVLVWELDWECEFSG